MRYPDGGLTAGQRDRRMEEVAVEGWCSVEELVRWGFAHAPVVMANEAHSGLARCIRTRDVGIRMIRAAHQAGVRRLAMEALPWQDRDIGSHRHTANRPPAPEPVTSAIEDR